MDYQEQLRSFKPAHEFFTGIDSDGCVFNTMEIKQKNFFIPVAIEMFNLEKISRIVRKTWEFVNLYSIHRGGNRFISFVKVIDLLSENEEVRQSGVKLPETRSLKEWISRENKLGNDNLRKYLDSVHDVNLEKILRWSETLNERIASKMEKPSPFAGAVDAIRKLSGFSDIVIVSQTPLQALSAEWKHAGIDKYASIIAGQESGTKSEQLSMAAGGKYAQDKILMIGDAKGDSDAARDNGILFFPVIPGQEEQSWQRFLTGGIDHFIGGSFDGDYESTLLGEFFNSLPDNFIQPGGSFPGPR